MSMQVYMSHKALFTVSGKGREGKGREGKGRVWHGVTGYDDQVECVYFKLIDTSHIFHTLHVTHFM